MNDKVEEIVTHPLFIPVVVGVTSFASGLGLGFFLGKRKQELVADPEVHELTPVEFEVEEKEAAVSTPRPPEPVVINVETAKEKGILKVDSLSDLKTSMVLPDDVDTETEIVEEVTEEVVEEVTVEEAEDGIEWDWEKELTERVSTRPYILHQEEFYNQELGFTQYPLTYYAMDQILVDDDNVPLYNISSVVGEMTFGHGSGQEDVVYIRNHERKAEYEITRLDDSFARVVHGLEIENNERIKDLKHGKVMKFRKD